MPWDSHIRNRPARPEYWMLRLLRKRVKIYIFVAFSQRVRLYICYLNNNLVFRVLFFNFQLKISAVITLRTRLRYGSLVTQLDYFIVSLFCLFYCLVLSNVLFLLFYEYQSDRHNPASW